MKRVLVRKGSQGLPSGTMVVGNRSVGLRIALHSIKVTKPALDVDVDVNVNLV